MVFHYRIQMECSYLGGESNPYLMFRKHLFYPLNYQGKYKNARSGRFITSGIDVYFDEYDTKIDRTRPYSVVSAIKTGIRNSTHMLCLLSQNALDSKWIPWEVGYGYDRTTVVGLTLKEISQSVLPEYLQIVPILRGTKSLNNFISNVLKRDESTLINERKLFAAYQSQHPLDSVLNWEL